MPTRLTSPKPYLVGPYQVYEGRLDNGLRLLVAENKQDPSATSFLTYNVGSADEEPGRTGFAHLFEHLMFEGSENVGKNEFFRHVQAVGGKVNGFTTDEMTCYYEQVPANHLNLAFWLESDRMRSLAITAENIRNQKDVVIEEKRQRYDNEPYGQMLPTIVANLFETQGYSHATIGHVEDIEAASDDDVRRFFDKHYGPSNAILTVVGNVDAKAVVDLASEYFGDIDGRNQNTRVHRSEAPLTAPKAIDVDDANAKLPAVALAFRVPNVSHDDAMAYGMLSNALSYGQASRLHQRLIKQDRIGISQYGFHWEKQGPSLGLFFLVLNGNASFDQAAAVIFEEIAKIQKGEFDEAQLNRLKTVAKAELIHGLQRSLSVARQVSTDVLRFQDPYHLKTRLAQLEALQPEDVIRAAQTYLGPDRALTLRFHPSTSQAGAA